MRSFKDVMEKSDLSTDFDSIRISLASPEKIRAWSRGEVTKPKPSITALSSRKRMDCSVPDLWPGDGLGVLVRQVQAHEVSRRGLR